MPHRVVCLVMGVQTEIQTRYEHMPQLQRCMAATDSKSANDYRSTTFSAIERNKNKSPKSNLGRGPRRGTVAHVRRKVPIGYNGAPEIRPQMYPFPLIDPRTPLPASSLDPSDLWRKTASGSDPPFFHNALDRPTYTQTHRPTDRPRESLMTIARYASNESDAA